MLSAIDEALTPSTDVDLFRIKIWDKDQGDVVIYDNQMGDDDEADAATAIGGGSIVIHKENVRSGLVLPLMSNDAVSNIAFRCDPDNRIAFKVIRIFRRT